LGKEGVAKVHGLGDIADWEEDLLKACLKDLANNIQKVTPSHQGSKVFRARTLLPAILENKSGSLIYILFIIILSH
jgi:hypothetical protein